MFCSKSSGIFVLLCGVFFLASTAAYADCACMMQQNEQERRARLQAMAHYLPSEADRLIAQNFRAQKLNDDAETYYRQSVQKATAELSDAKQKDAENPGTTPADKMEVLILHKAEIEKEAAGFLILRGKPAEAAAFREDAITLLQSAGREVDKEAEYRTLAQLYESGNQPRRSAEFYKRLAEHLQTTQGRYSSAVSDAMAQYVRVSKTASAVSQRRI